MCFVVGFFFLIFFCPFPYEEAFVLLSVKKVTSLFLFTRLLSHFFLSLFLSLGFLFCSFHFPLSFFLFVVVVFHSNKNIHFIFPFSFPLFFFFLWCFFF
jgi:hypothetical protein